MNDNNSLKVLSKAKNLNIQKSIIKKNKKFIQNNQKVQQFRSVSSVQQSNQNISQQLAKEIFKQKKIIKQEIESSYMQNMKKSIQMATKNALSVLQQVQQKKRISLSKRILTIQRCKLQTLRSNSPQLLTPINQNLPLQHIKIPISNPLPTTINLINTKYSVVQKAALQLGFKISYQNDTQMGLLDWNIKWTDSTLGTQYVRKMNRNQRINYFVGISAIARKNLLMVNLYKMKTQFYQQYDFFPQTFQYPQDLNKLQFFIKQHKQSKQNRQKLTFIVKPQASCQGKGIYLCQQLSDIELSSKSIVQQYLSKPLLYQNLKFDFRVYVLLKSLNPLQIYIYKQGLVRFATQQYCVPTKYNMDQLCIHLTNYAINKENPKYQFNQGLNNMNYGHKKSLAEFFKILKSKAIDTNKIWSDIKQAVVKTIIAVQPHLQYQYRKAQPKNQDQSLCFQVLGFDFILDQNMKLYLLEVNQSPSFLTQTPLDLLVKNYLISDTLKILNEDKSKINFQLRLKRSKTQACTTQSPKNKIKQQKIKQKSENNTDLGNYQLIHPSKDTTLQKEYYQIINFSKVAYHDKNYIEYMKNPQINLSQRKDNSQKQLIKRFNSSIAQKVFQQRQERERKSFSPKLPNIIQKSSIFLKLKQTDNKKNLIIKDNQSPTSNLRYLSQRQQIFLKKRSQSLQGSKKLIQKSNRGLQISKRSIQLSKKQKQKQNETILKNCQKSIKNNQLINDILTTEFVLQQKSHLLSNRPNLFQQISHYKSLNSKQISGSKSKLTNFVQQKRKEFHKIKEIKNYKTLNYQQCEDQTYQTYDGKLLSRYNDNSNKIRPKHQKKRSVTQNYTQQDAYEETPLQRFMKYMNPLNKIAAHRLHNSSIQPQ